MNKAWLLALLLPAYQRMMPLKNQLNSASMTTIQSSPDVLGGTPVFAGTRVPVQTLLDYLESGDRIDDFLQDFPSVSRDQAVQVLEIAKDALLSGPHASAP